MLNVKNKLLPILCLALCLCILLGFTTTAHAVDGVVNVLNKAPEVGGEFYYRCTNQYTSGNVQYEQYIDYTCTITSSNIRSCFYLTGFNDTYCPNGYITSGEYFDKLGSATIYTVNLSDGTTSSAGSQSIYNCKPYCYQDTRRLNNITNYSTLSFETNIPIFESMTVAKQYVDGQIGIEKALNYNKVLENGSWVAPFDSIEINDNEVDLPKVSNLSHQGFTLTNNPTEKSYLVELYVENGLRNPVNLQDANLGDAISNSISGYGHTYGMLDPVTDAYNYQTVFDLAVDYGIDNVGNLTQTCRNFYSAYPSANSYNPILQTNKQTWSVWGQPFGKNYVFWSTNISLNDNDIATINCNSCPLAFTTYKIRYFYYDDTNGWHYGPWSVYTYFSNGQVGYSSVYQDDEDKILETDTFYGEQDSIGNVTVNTSGISSEQFIDLNNPNELFGYIRSVTNNVSATMGNFSTLFATVFTFIPADVQYMIWFGIAVMVIIGVVKVIKG